MPRLRLAVLYLVLITALGSHPTYLAGSFNNELIVTLEKEEFQYCAEQDIIIIYESNLKLDSVAIEELNAEIKISEEFITLNGELKIGQYNLIFFSGECKTSVLINIVQGVIDPVDLIDIEKCEEDTISLLMNPNPNYVYGWSPDLFLTSNDESAETFTPIPQVYYVRVSDKNNICSYEDSISVKIITPDYSFEVRPSLECVPDNITIVLRSSETIDSVRWNGRSPDRQVSNSFFFDQLTDSLLYPTVFINNCSFFYTLVISRDNQRLDISFDQTSYCLDDSVRISLSSPLSFALASSSDYLRINDSSLVTQSDGQNLQLRVNFVDCIAFYDISVTTDSLPVIDAVFNKSLYCPDDSIIVLNDDYTRNNCPDLKTNWLINNELIAMGDTLELLASGNTQNITRVLENNACKSIDTFNISISGDSFQPEWTDTSVCRNAALLIDLNELASDTWTWTDKSALSCTSCRDVMIATDSTFSTTISYNIGGCSFHKDFQVGINENESFLLDTVYTCIDEDFGYILPDSIPDGKWENNEILDCLECRDPIINASRSEMITFVVTENAQCTTRYLLPVIVFPRAEITVDIDEQPYNEGDIILISTPLLTDNFELSWIVNGIVLGSSQEITFTLIQGLNEIVLLARNLETNCSSELVSFVTAAEVVTPEVPLAIPNVFTPNEDGTNDIFRASGSSNRTRGIKIFDRFGVLVTQVDGGWNGTYQNGTLAPPGIYYYQLSAINEEGNIQIFEGQVTLSR